MSEAAAGTPAHTGIDASGKYPVQYRFSHAKKGNQHLVVVFANFSAPDDYGWSNGIFDGLTSNILWIRDQFDGMNSYYLCKGMDFELERSVITLISNVMNSLGLTPDQCTMWGGAKGGSAALYYGLKYGFRNVVSIAPQFMIGTHLRNHPAVAEFMMGQVTEGSVQALDQVLPDMVRSGTNRGANIYLLSSPQDEQYPVQVEPFLGLFNGYENFNFIFSDSPHISGHTQVTTRNVPVLLGLVSFLIDGMAPRLGFTGNGHERPDADRAAIDGYLRVTSQVRTAFPTPVVHTPVPGQWVSTPAVRFSGTAPGAVRVSVWENGKFLGSPPVEPDGSWSWQAERPWSEGEHLTRVFGVDSTGFASPATDLAFTVPAPGSAVPDPLPAAGLRAPGPQMSAALPGPVVSVPAPGQQVPGPVIGLMGYAPGAAHVGFVEDDMRLGMAQVAPDGSWSWESGWSWTAGTHTVECHAVDMGGNESRRTAVTFGVVNA